VIRRVLIYFSRRFNLGDPNQQTGGCHGSGDLSHAGKNLAFFRQGNELSRRTISSPVTAGTSNSKLALVSGRQEDRLLAEHELECSQRFPAGRPSKRQACPIQGFAWAPGHSGLIVSTHGELWFVPRMEGRSPSQLTFGELAYESPDVDSAGNVVVSRRSLDGSRGDIVMFSGLKWCFVSAHGPSNRAQRKHADAGPRRLSFIEAHREFSSHEVLPIWVRPVLYSF
jgi:hypothetical protein